MLDEESSAIIEETQQSYKKSDCVESTLAVTENKDSEDEDEADQPMPESLRLMLGEAMHKEEEDSRATRSNLHVNTIGLTSSTLDLELHALRNLVFNEILGTEALSTENDTKKTAIEKNPEQDLPVESIPVDEGSINDEDAIDDNLENLDFVDEMELLDEPITKPSSMGHECKRLSLKRSGELRDLKEALPMEKRLKFKPCGLAVMREVE